MDRSSLVRARRCSIVALALGAALIATGCGGAETRERAKRDDTVTLAHVSRNDTLGTLRRQLRRSARAHEIASRCALVWGDLLSTPPSARRARIGCEGDRAIEGVVLCGQDLQTAMNDPRAHQIAVLLWRDDELQLGDVSQGGTVALSDVAPAQAPTAALFDADSSDARAAAQDVVGELSHAGDKFVVIAWPLE